MGRFILAVGAGVVISLIVAHLFGAPMWFAALISFAVAFAFGPRH